MHVQSIYKCLWRMLFLLVSFCNLCRWLHFRIIAFVLWSYDLCQTQAKRQQNECEFLRQCKKQLKKIPKHLNVIIGPEVQHVNEDILSRLFTYALYMNIECVSYYDTRLQSSVNDSGLKHIPLNKIKCPESLKFKSSDDHHTIWYCEDVECRSNGKKTTNSVVNETSVNNGSSKSLNGNVATLNSRKNNMLEIYEILPNDNRQLIAQVCRNLFRQRHSAEIQHMLKTRNHLTCHIDHELKQKLRNLTEPDLSIVFHENLSTFGMLPWHTRFTEFHCHEPERRFDVESFARILYKYSRCEQRWGK